jgi:divalent metal cation (Fe/Co/Zn/Cd) transporter
MDSIDPALIDQAEAALRDVPGVLGAGQVRMRWIGHRLRAECAILVDPASTAAAAHRVAAEAEHALVHAIPRLTAAVVHADVLADHMLDGAEHDHDHALA